jgi:ribonucleoside-diphosphate reductase alpha chain
MYFWSTTNATNATPHLGDINATNPCGETPNISDEPCNLGSLALSRFFKKVGNNWVFMWDEYREAVKTAIRFMDDILDWNVFPHPDITRMAMSTRKLGLGVMGYADALAMLKIPYDSQDAVDWGSAVAQFNAEVSLETSMSLARSKGPYPAYESATKVTKEKFPWCRNSTRTSIAPTGTIALLADASSSIEPHYALEWERTTGEGIKLKEKIPVSEMIGDFVPKVAEEINYTWHVKHQAAWQKYTDLGVSKTINMPKSATVQQISDAYALMWKLGCKGGTVFRDGCRDEQVLRKSEPTTLYLAKDKEATEEDLKAFAEKYIDGLQRYMVLPKPTSNRKKLPKERTGSTVKFSIGGTKGFLTANAYEDGTLGEIFIVIDKDGSTIAGMMNSFAMTFSTALQNGTPLETLVKLHKNSVFEPRGMTGDKDVPNCTSIPDYIVRKLEIKFLGGKTAEDREEDDKIIALLRPFPIRHKPILTNPDRPKFTEGNATTLPKEAWIGEYPEKSGKGLTGQFCPDCGTELIREGSCMRCTKPGCGFSKC